jgi:hypothetical protein
MVAFESSVEVSGDRGDGEEEGDCNRRAKIRMER